MFIISHRGAAGLAPENTIEGIILAKKHKVNAIEVDIRLSSDQHFVLCHDPTLLRGAGSFTKISNLTLKEIQLTATNSGHPIPSLQEAIEETKKTPLVLDCKGQNWARPLSELLNNYSKNKFMICSDNHQELIKFHVLSPNIEVYASAWGHAFDALYVARQAGLNGVSLSYGLFNPITYHFAKRAKLKMIMSQINRRFIARIMHSLYPQAMITTDFPNRLIGQLGSDNT